MNFQATSKFVIVFVRLILPKVLVDGCTIPRQESDVRYECHFKLKLKVKLSVARYFLYYFLFNSGLLWAKAWNNEYESESSESVSRISI